MSNGTRFFELHSAPCFTSCNSDDWFWLLVFWDIASVPCLLSLVLVQALSPVSEILDVTEIRRLVDAHLLSVTLIKLLLTLRC